MEKMRTDHVTVDPDNLTDRQEKLVKMISVFGVWLEKLGYDFKNPADRDEFILFVNAFLAARLEMLNENPEQNENDQSKSTAL